MIQCMCVWLGWVHALCVPPPRILRCMRLYVSLLSSWCARPAAAAGGWVPLVAQLNPTQPNPTYNNQHDFFANVVRGGERPPINKRWPKEFAELLQACWDPNPANRPPMCQVCTDGCDCGVGWARGACAGIYFHASLRSSDGMHPSAHTNEPQKNPGVRGAEGAAGGRGGAEQEGALLPAHGPAVDVVLKMGRREKERKGKERRLAQSVVSRVGRCVFACQRPPCLFPTRGRRAAPRGAAHFGRVHVVLSSDLHRVGLCG